MRRSVAAAWRLPAIVLAGVAVARAAGGLTPACSTGWAGGADLFFDGVDDLLVAFPSFSTLSDFTLEAWVQPEAASLNATQCLFHQSTYSAQTLLSLRLDQRRWALQLGEHVVTAPDSFTISSEQYHVAVTYAHDDSVVRLYIDAVEALSEVVPAPVISDPVLGFLVGACQSPTLEGLELREHFAGHVDELRHWPARCSPAQVEALRFKSGPAAGWSAEELGCSSAGPTQYNFDGSVGSGLALDGSGNGQHGMLGGGAASEMPAYGESVFAVLDGRAQFTEFWPAVDYTFELNQLLGCGNYSAILIRDVPATSVATLRQGASSGSALAAGAIVTGTTALHVRSEQAVAHDAFEVQLCANGTLESCAAGEVYGFAFAVREGLRPTAGDARSVRLLGQGGFVALREPLRESGTVEFWVQMAALERDQALFSVSSATGDLVMGLSVSGGALVASLCSAGVALSQEPLLGTTPEHLAVSWQRVGSGYTFSVYRNCQLIGASSLEDSCVHFGAGAADAALMLPTLGQRYQLDGQRLVSAEFADAYLDDIRVWARAVPQAEICQQQGRLLDALAADLRAHFVAAAASRQGLATVLPNRVPGGLPADLSCSFVHVACPNASAAIGYALVASVFELPGLPLSLETSAGYADGASLLDALRVDLPMHDRDNLGGAGVVDSLTAKVTMAPDASCGQLFLGDLATVIAQNDTVAEADLPLFFKPSVPPGASAEVRNAFACTTSVEYLAMDGQGLMSAHAEAIEIAVRVPGPAVEAVQIMAAGGPDDGLGAGDRIAIKFNGSTDGLASWDGLFTVLNGSLGAATCAASWSASGDTLVLELGPPLEGVELTPGLTRLRLLAAAGLRAAGGASYPCLGPSPAVQGAFDAAACPADEVYSTELGECAECGVGFYRPSHGRSCHECPAGSFAGDPRQSACADCEPGTFANTTGLSACAPAQPGFYVPGSGEVQEYPCPQGAVAEAAGSTACARCPAGADCDTPQHPRSFAAPEGQSFRMRGGRVVACGIPPACLGWDFELDWNRCRQGMDGYLCQSCAAGWWRPHDQPHALCGRCTDAWESAVPLLAGVLVVFVVVWAVGVLSLDAVFWGNLHVALLRSLSAFLLAASVASRVQAWEVRAVLGEDLARRAVSVLSVLFRSNGALPGHLLGLECWLGSAFSDKGPWWRIRVQVLFWLSAIPLFVASLFAVVLFFFQCYTIGMLTQQKVLSNFVPRAKYKSIIKASKDDFMRAERLGYIWQRRAALCAPRDRIRVLWRDTTPLFVAGCYLLAPTVISELVVAMRCDKLDRSGGEWRLLAAPEVVCWSGEHTLWFGAAAAGAFVYGMLLPGLLSAFLRARATSRRVGGAGDGHAGPSRRTRTVIPALANDFQFQARYCLVLDGYSSSFAYWEGVVWLRRGLLLLVGAWPNLSRSAEFVLYQVIGVVFLLIHMWTKPFDSRMGEFLDRVEQNGLCLFLLLVSSVQVLLIAEGEGALLPVLLCAASFALALLLSEVGGSEQWVLLARFHCVCLFIGLLVFCWASGPEEQRAAFFAVLLAAVALCALFALWVVLGVLAQLQKALSELFERQRNFEAKHQSPGQRAADAWELARSRSNNLLQGVADAVPALRGGPLERAKTWLIREHRSRQPALVRFDTGTRELVLGLHPDRYLYDTSMSAYARRQLSKLAPFLSDMERRAVATSLRDGLLHLIFDCDQVVVHGHLLEFLVRVAFARRFEELVAAGGAVRARRASRSSWRPSGRGAPPSGSEDWRALGELLADPRVFERGMAAYDFQWHMESITKIPKSEVEVLLARFVADCAPPPSPASEVREVRVSSRSAEPS